MGILLDFIYPAHHPHETQHFPHPLPQKVYYTSMPPPIKTKPAPWSFVYSSTIASPQILATTLVGCRYWILPLTYTHPEDGTSPISKSAPSCPPWSQYTHTPLPATHHCAAVPPLIDSGLTVSTTVPHPSTSNQGSVDGIQTNRCHFGSPPPPIEIKKRYQRNCAECTCSHRCCVFILPSDLECTRCRKMHLLCFFQISCK
jgi:hypothetical protein